MLVYLDSNIVIYLLEQPANFGPRASARIQALLSAGDRLVVSDLTRVECRSTPLACGDLATLSHYDVFFRQVVEFIQPLDPRVCDRATIIRGRHGFKDT